MQQMSELSNNSGRTSYSFFHFIVALVLLIGAGEAVAANRDGQIFDVRILGPSGTIHGACPQELVFWGSITLNATEQTYSGDIIEYRYHVSDGSTTRIEKRRYDPKKKAFKDGIKLLPVEIDGPGEFKVKFEVISPENMSSGWSNVKVTCDAAGKVVRHVPPRRSSRLPTVSLAGTGGASASAVGSVVSTGTDLLTLTVEPADQNTRRFVESEGRSAGSGSSSGSYRTVNARLTNRNGWYDSLPPTVGQSSSQVCMAACSATEQCVALVYETSSGDQPKAGGFCGLIFDEARTRWDKAWIEKSRNYKTLVKHGTAVPNNINDVVMVGTRTVALTAAVRSGQGWGVPTPLWNEKYVQGTEGNASCVVKCVEDDRCYQVAFNRQGYCAGFPESGGRAQLRSISGFENNAAFVGYINTYDRKPRRQAGNTFNSLFDESVGLGLFSKLALDSIKSLDASLANQLKSPSAAMHTDRDGIWRGEKPPVATNIQLADDESELEVLDLSGFLNSDFTAGFLPFHNQVWRSKTERGTYYYAPRSYWLYWDSRTRKLGGSQFFNQAGAIGDGQDVRIQLKVDGGISPDDLDVFRRFVNAAVAKNRMPPVAKLLPYPVTGTPTTDLGNNIVGRDVEVTAQNSTSIGRPVEMVFTLSDENAKGLIDALLTPGQSVGASISMTSNKIAQPNIRLPVVLDPYASGNYGTGRVVDSHWVNTSPMPAYVRSVKALKINTDSATVYFWNVLNTASVNPGGAARLLKSDNMPNLRDIDLVWVEYDLDTSCKECAQNLFGVGAVTAEARSVLRIKLTNNVMSEYDVDEVDVFIRSRYFDPGSTDSTLSQPITLTPDSMSGESPPLYLPDGKQFESGNDSLLI